jgi:hypothetical protein
VASGLTIYAGKLYFYAQNSGGFIKLYFYGDTIEKVVQVSDLIPGASDGIQNLTVVGTKLYFLGYRTGTNSKLFSLCDPDAGC